MAGPVLKGFQTFKCRSTIMANPPSPSRVTSVMPRIHCNSSNLFIDGMRILLSAKQKISSNLGAICIKRDQTTATRVMAAYLPYQ
jgi:hypothetical protein